MKQTSCIKVIFFQRKPRPGFNFSIESIFINIRKVLRNKIQCSVQYSSSFNNGYFSKLYNIIEAAVRQKKSAVLHITGETHFLNLLMRKKNVLLTIHDCRFVERKKGLQQKLITWLYLKAPVAKAAYITTVSEVTKQDVIRYTNCDAEKIKVIPVSVHEVFKPAHHQFNFSQPKVLQIGVAENKNLQRVIEALKPLSCELIIIGRLNKQQLVDLKDANVNFINAYNLSYEELYNYYKECDIVSFISTFEGFGMPVIEAQFVERPVITSNVSSMPEVAGEGACLVDPYNIEEIRNGFLKIINDADYRQSLIKKGIENRMRFNTQTIAVQYYQLYEKIYKNISA